MARIDARVREAAQLGFLRAVIPAGQEAEVRGLGIELVPLTHVRDCIEAVFGARAAPPKRRDRPQRPTNPVAALPRRAGGLEIMSTAGSDSPLSRAPSAFRTRSSNAAFRTACSSSAVPVRTAADAAQAMGCEVGQIAKSIVFRTRFGRAVLVIASGANRVNEDRIEALLGEAIEKADPDFVREQTGFAIGGIPPLGHTNKMTTYIDRDLFRFEVIWAAAGHPNALFELVPDELVNLTGGIVAELT